MKTLKLYQQDVELCQCDSTLQLLVSDKREMEALGAKKQDNTFLVVLNQTVFFPEGGGQPCDAGFLGGLPVFFVFEEEGVVYHQLSAPSSLEAACSLLCDGGKSGETVHCEIDWSRRFLHMQMHCGEHILSGMFYQEYGGVNRGFHMGSDYMTIDINLEQNPLYTQFTQDMIDNVELLANKAVWANLPVTTLQFDTQAEASSMKLRKELDIQQDISIVCVGSPEHPADCVACCGTHPKISGQVGLIKILKAEAYKGMTRFLIKAGQPAFADYTLKHRISTKLCGQHSTEPEQLLERIQIQETKNGAVRKELYELKKNLLDQQAEAIRQVYEALDSQARTPIVIRRYDYLGTDDLQTLGRRVTPMVKGLLLLIAQKENTVLLISQGQPDCGKLVKENAEIYQGKGGGNSTLARAIFTKEESVETYLDLLEKHLR